MPKPEDVLEQVLTGELTREQAVEQAPEMEDRLRLLASLSDDLRALPRQAPDPEFRHRARLHLLQHIEQTQRRRRWWRGLADHLYGLPGWASTISAVVIASGGLTFGVSYASASALPDDRLYPVKRAVEHVQVAMASSDEAKANAYLDLADRRAEELAATAGQLDDQRLQGLTHDYGTALQGVTLAVQTLPAPPAPLLDKVQAHVASQATELEARALNSAGRPAVQEQLVQAEVVASNTVDHVVLVAEQSGRPGPRDVQLAQDAPAAATAAAVALGTPANQPAGTGSASASGPNQPAAVAPASQRPASAGSPAAANPATTRGSAVGAAATTTGTTALDGQYDHLWNEVAAAPFMGQHVRTQLEVDVANAKQDTRAGHRDAAVADLNAFSLQLQAAVAAHQATGYTATHLIAEAKALVAALR